MLSLLVLGCLAGLLSGLFGIGGGIVMVPTLALLFSMQGVAPQWIMSLASGTSLATMTLATLMAALRHQSKGAVNWSIIGSLIPGILLGTMIGVRLSSYLPSLAIKILFCLIACFVGLNMMFGQMFTKAILSHPNNRGVWLGLGLGVGLFAGLLGLGGGVLLVPLLCVFGINLKVASATASVCTFPTAVVGGASAVWFGWGVAGLPANTFGFVYWPAMLTVGLTSVLFAWIGVELAHCLPIPVLRKTFGGTLIILVISWLLVFL